MKTYVFITVNLDRGKTIPRFWNAGLIDQMTMTTITVLTSSGIALFGLTSQDIHLKPAKNRTSAVMLVQHLNKVIN